MKKKKKRQTHTPNPSTPPTQRPPKGPEGGGMYTWNFPNVYFRIQATPPRTSQVMKHEVPESQEIALNQVLEDFREDYLSQIEIIEPPIETEQEIAAPTEYFRDTDIEGRAPGWNFPWLRPEKEEIHKFACVSVRVTPKALVSLHARMFAPSHVVYDLLLNVLE